ncbi:hypothetical protein SUGI_0682820 [Cryptomeria japonica]|nr:hypothetical protein SUGI_0682820 [Cryptomeria japonica]
MRSSLRKVQDPKISGEFVLSRSHQGVYLPRRGPPVIDYEEQYPKKMQDQGVVLVEPSQAFDRCEDKNMVEEDDIRSIVNPSTVEVIKGSIYPGARSKGGVVEVIKGRIYLDLSCERCSC